MPAQAPGALEWRPWPTAPWLGPFHIKTKNPATARAIDKYLQVLKCGQLTAPQVARLCTSEH